MKYTQILKRAWQILWHYPALWVIGILLALTGGASGGGSSGLRFSGNNNNYWQGFQFDPPAELSRKIEQLNRYMDSHFGNINENTILMWAIIAALVILILVVIGVFIKYISLTATIRMVDHLENTGEKVSWRKGLRWGWSRSAFRLWLIRLVVVIPTFLLFLVLFGCAALPVLLGLAGGRTSTAAGIIATIGIGFLVFLIVFIVAVLITVWLRFASRECVIQNQGVMASLSASWKSLRNEWKDISIMWLILTGVRIGIGIAMIPVVLILIALSAALAGGIGLLIYGIAGMSITAILVGVALFILLLGAPMLLISGLKETYFETSWTLVYRDIQAPLPEKLDELPEDSNLAEA
jgi:hypothetical protein